MVWERWSSESLLLTVLHRSLNEVNVQMDTPLLAATTDNRTSNFFSSSARTDSWTSDLVVLWVQMPS